MLGTNKQMIVLKKAIRVDMSIAIWLKRFDHFSKTVGSVRLNQHSWMAPDQHLPSTLDNIARSLIFPNFLYLFLPLMGRRHYW